MFDSHHVEKMEVNPLNIFFVKSDSKGDRLLFRYPYSVNNKDEYKQQRAGRKNPYAINSVEDLLQNPLSQTSNIYKGQLTGFTDEMLSTLFAVKAELCNRKFELKVNDIRFVGHPTLLPYRTNKDDTAAMILINVVFALQASASHSIVKCYYDLSKRLGKAMRYEEKRCSYLTQEIKTMLATHDEVSAMDPECNAEESEEVSSRHSSGSTSGDTEPRSPFHLILQRSSLARSMKAVFEELTHTGIVQVRINKWVLLSFCLPHKAHQIHNKGLVIEPQTIDRCLQKLRPYHGMLLLVNPNDLLALIPIDGSPALIRLLKMYSPLKSLQTLALETDLTLLQVFQLTGHLVYWAKATVIYPLCEGNVYVVAPMANVHAHSPLVADFAREFPSLSLIQMLSEFSLPAPLWFVARGGGAGGGRVARATAWMLRRRLLMQLHTYVYYSWPHHTDSDGINHVCENHTDCNELSNISFSSLNHIHLNIPECVDNGKSEKSRDSDEDYPTENNLNQKYFSHTKPIVIDSSQYRHNDSANHSYDDGVDVVDGVAKLDTKDEISNGKIKEIKKEGNSVDSGIPDNVTNPVSAFKQIIINKESLEESNKDAVENKSEPKKLTLRLPSISGNPLNKDGSFDDDYRNFSDSDDSPRQKRNGVLNSLDGNEAESVTVALSACERAALAAVPAVTAEDLALLTTLHDKGYLRGEQHLEEIMFMENVSRSQLMQLLDKFKEVLITFETEDPAVAMLYPHH